MVFARTIMNPVMKIISKLKSRESFLLTILLCIAAWAAAFDYFMLPMAIGAFLAGMLFSETLYNNQVKADIAPYQTLFAGLFFTTLGMGLDLPLLARNIWVVGGGAAALVILKFAAIYAAARWRRVRARDAFLTALLLAQGGEFGLLILQTIKIRAFGEGVIAFPHPEIITAIILVSMILSPLLLWLYDRLSAQGILYSQKLAAKYNAAAQNKKPDVIICGFGRVGMTIARMFGAKNISYTAIDMNADRVVAGREMGFEVVYGDTTQGGVLGGFGLKARTTKAVIVALDNSAVAKKTVRAAKRIAPKTKIFARARNLQESKILIGEGAKVALPETIESSFLLAREVMTEMGVDDKDVKKIMTELRKNNYGMIEE